MTKAPSRSQGKTKSKAIFTKEFIASSCPAEIASVLNHAYLTICQLEQKIIEAGKSVHDSALRIPENHLQAIIHNAKPKEGVDIRPVPFIPFNKETPVWMTA